MKRLTFLFLLLNHTVQSQIETMQLPRNLVIAHRGTTFCAPEETEVAMRWARNAGADYLEFDLQRTKDGVLIALHDNTLVRTTNVELKFPERKDAPVSHFTYAELLTLDAGSWFNIAIPKNASRRFEGLDILSLEDIVQIAEGKKICRHSNGKRIILEGTNGKIQSQYETDPTDNGNRPGLYIETKVPDLFPGIETDLKIELIRLGWYNPEPGLLKRIPIKADRVQIGSTTYRIILQTFSKNSLVNLNNNFSEHVPKCLLLWRGSDPDDIQDDSPETFRKHIEFGKQNGATIAGPSISGKPNEYTDLLTPLHVEILRKSGYLIHAYSFDTKEQFDKYNEVVDGMFTNRADYTLQLYKRGEIGK